MMYIWFLFFMCVYSLTSRLVFDSKLNLIDGIWRSFIKIVPNFLTIKRTREKIQIFINVFDRIYFFLYNSKTNDRKKLKLSLNT